MPDLPPPPAPRHECWFYLGDADNVEANTLRACDECGRWWRSIPTYRFWTESEWFPVRWWQWRLRAYIKQQELERR